MLARWLGDLESDGQNHAGIGAACSYLGVEVEVVWDFIRNEKRTNGQPKFMVAFGGDDDKVALAVVVQRAGIPGFQFVE